MGEDGGVGVCVKADDSIIGMSWRVERKGNDDSDFVWKPSRRENRARPDNRRDTYNTAQPPKPELALIREKLANWKMRCPQSY